MTVDEYYAAVRSLGLRPSTVPNVYLDRDNEPKNVPDGHKQTAEQRKETYERIRGLLQA